MDLNVLAIGVAVIGFQVLIIFIFWQFFPDQWDFVEKRFRNLFYPDKKQQWKKSKQKLKVKQEKNFQKQQEQNKRMEIAKQKRVDYLKSLPPCPVCKNGKMEKGVNVVKKPENLAIGCILLLFSVIGFIIGLVLTITLIGAIIGIPIMIISLGAFVVSLFTRDTEECNVLVCKSCGHYTNRI